MINLAENEKMNCNLAKLYKENTEKFLQAWNRHYDFKSIERINEFGIIDIENYDTDNGILFIAKETNGWDYSTGETFRLWIEDMAKHGRVIGEIASKHPQIWYNLGRWAKFIANPEIDKLKLINEKEDSLTGLRMIAFTNLNKAEGESISGKPFWDLIDEDIVSETLKDEIKELNPKIILLCGIKKKYIQNVIQHIDKSIKIIEMPHPSARNIKKLDMLKQLENELLK